MDPSRNWLWEERIIIVQGDSVNAAESLARNWAVQQETAYGVEGGDAVQWSFEQIERVVEIDSDELASCTEVFSRFLHESEVRSLLTPFDE